MSFSEIYNFYALAFLTIACFLVYIHTKRVKTKYHKIDTEYIRDIEVLTNELRKIKQENIEFKKEILKTLNEIKNKN